MEDINHNRMEVEESWTKDVVEEDSLVYPALPQEVWLQVFRGLPEGDLARVAQVSCDVINPPAKKKMVDTYCTTTS